MRDSMAEHHLSIDRRDTCGLRIGYAPVPTSDEQGPSGGGYGRWPRAYADICGPGPTTIR